MEDTKYLKYLIPIVLLFIFLIISVLLGIFYASITDSIWTWANSVTLSGIGFASSISLYALLHSSEQFNKQIRHSNNQLEEQLTRRNKEEAIFKFFSKIIIIINKIPIHTPYGSKSNSKLYNMFEDAIKYDIENSRKASVNPKILQLSYNYFKELIQKNPLIFYYLPIGIQEAIGAYDKTYTDLINNIEDSIDRLVDEKTEFKNLDEFLSKKRKWDLDNTISIVRNENNKLNKFFIAKILSRTEKENDLLSNITFKESQIEYNIIIENNEYFDGLEENEEFLREKFIKIYKLAKTEKEKYGYLEKI